jgi:predicted deacylase
MAELKVGSAAISKPGIAKGWLKVGDMPHGQPMEVPVMLVKGAKAGPTLWLQAAIHGNEYSGTYIIHEFIRNLDPKKLKGDVVAIPALNITAYQAGTRGSPFDIYGGSDMNRVFPGKVDGTLTEQMAYHVYNELKRVATAMVDFHTAFMPNTRWSLFTKVDGEAGKKAEGMARAFGYPVILPSKTAVLSSSCYMCAAREGIPGLIVEAGGKGPGFTPEVVKDGAERMRNVARELGMIDEPVAPPRNKSVFISEFAWVRATRGGLFQPTVTCGDTIKKGQVIGQYFDMFGDLVDEARASHPGVVLNMHPGPLMISGETLIHIGLDPQAA